MHFHGALLFHILYSIAGLSLYYQEKTNVIIVGFYIYSFHNSILSLFLCFLFHFLTTWLVLGMDFASLIMSLRCLLGAYVFIKRDIS